MYITWYGQGCFKLEFTDSNREISTVFIDPYEEKVGLKAPDEKADILLISHEHFDHNNAKAIKGEPFIIREPGEYELKEVFIEGIGAFHDNSQGKERGAVTMFVLHAEELRICFLSDLGQAQLTDEQLERIGTVDVALVPVGGVFTIDGLTAKNVINQIDPKLVIPMHYKIKGLKVDLEGPEKFLKAMSQEAAETTKKLKLQAKDLSAQEPIKVVLLEAQG